MPTITDANLTLTTTDDRTTINVKYNVVFSVLERRLAGLGLIFRERIRVIGVDPPGSTTGTTLHNFPAPNLPVTDGGTPQTLARDQSMTVSRASLQEDSGLGDNDEIRCRIRIAALGLPPAETPDVFTDQEVLPG
jgi:hypothetical protein